VGASVTFQIGEKVVYPNHGVGTIENISQRPFGNRLERFYLLRLTSNQLTVMVPFSHAGDVGLRRVTKNAELTRVLQYLAEGRVKSPQDWKDRYKENCEKMNSGSTLEIAEVLKSLLIVQSDKPLSFREKKMLDRARHMLITEFCTSRQLRDQEAVDLLDKALIKSSLRLPAPL
jgi:CarD family transcriptional regulator